MKRHRIFFVAPEPSGDQLAAETLTAMRAARPNTDLEVGIMGGAYLEHATGKKTVIKTDALAIHGFLDAIRAYPRVRQLVKSAADAILAFEPDTVILVDSWGYSIRLAQELKKRNPAQHIIKLVGPQVWAMRAGRAKKLAKVVDHVLCLLDLEPPIYAPHGVSTTVIGLPALTRAEAGDADALLARYKIAPETQILLVLPGSRPSEIKRVAPALMEAAAKIKAALPETRIIVAPSENIRQDFLAGCQSGLIQNDFDFDLLDENFSAYDAMGAATYALACSGTVTTELAMKSVPMLVAYKADFVAYYLTRYLLFKPNYVTILNILEDKGIIPEFLQNEQKPEAIAKEAIKMLSSPTQLMMQLNAQNKAVPKLGSTEDPAPNKAARAIWADLDKLVQP